MQKKRSIHVCGVIVALMCLVSLMQTSTETYHYYLSVDDAGEGFGPSMVMTIVIRVVVTLFALGSSVLFFRHKEIGRKGILLVAYAGLIYMGYVFYGMYESSNSMMFLLIGVGNVLLIAMFIRWLHSRALREVIQ